MRLWYVFKKSVPGCSLDRMLNEVMLDLNTHHTSLSDGVY